MTSTNQSIDLQNARAAASVFPMPPPHAASVPPPPDLLVDSGPGGLNNQNILSHLHACNVQGGGGETNPQLSESEALPPKGPEPIPLGGNSASFSLSASKVDTEETDSTPPCYDPTPPLAKALAPSMGRAT